MSAAAEAEFENLSSLLNMVLTAISERTVWNSSLVRDSLVGFVSDEVEALRVDKLLYTFSDEPAIPDGHFQLMRDALRRLLEEIANVTDAADWVESRIWTGLEEWLDARYSRVSFLAFERSTSHPTIQLPDEVSAAIAPAQASRQRARMQLERELRLHQELQQSDDRSRQAMFDAAAADEARRQAQDLAAKSGDTALSEEFTKLADEQSSAAFRWTALSVVTTVVGIILGGVAHFLVPFKSSEAQLLYPLLIALGAGGLATYFARLGGHHRHSAAWAKSISVQLDSYAKFVENTNGDGKMRVFDQFAGRVLGAPPPRSEKAAMQSATIADIAAIVTRSPT